MGSLPDVAEQEGRKSRKRCQKREQDQPKSGAQRTCVITRTQRPKGFLLRFVLAPNGGWTEDLQGRLPGKGLYVIPSPANVQLFLKRRGVALTESNATVERLANTLPMRFLQGIGLARRAGCLYRGLRAVSEMVGKAEEPVVLLAADTATHTRQKLEQLRHKHALQEVWELLDRSQLGAACGNNGPVAVLAVVGAGMGRRVQADAMRLQDFHNSNISSLSW